MYRPSLYYAVVFFCKTIGWSTGGWNPSVWCCLCLWWRRIYIYSVLGSWNSPHECFIWACPDEKTVNI